MASRAADWMGQAGRDMQLAGVALEAGLFEWTCSAAHQAAEKAVKAVAQACGGDARGHAISLLLRAVLGENPPSGVASAARRLDHFHVPTQDPHAWPEGKPGDFYTRQDAEGRHRRRLADRGVLRGPDGRLGLVDVGEQRVRPRGLTAKPPSRAVSPARSRNRTRPPIRRRASFRGLSPLPLVTHRHRGVP